MATAQTSSTETLFHQWRKGDAAAGQAMAQRFTDWYFAMATTRLGEDSGDAAFREACTQFSRGVGKVADARRLLGWAHTIARAQIEEVLPGGRLTDGDLPNLFTRRQSPKDLLVRARDHLPDELWHLETAYRGGPVEDAVALMEARYRVKTWLKQTFDLPFRVTPDRPDPDRAPLPFYEAGRMADEQEETHFELYMLHDMDVCQDVAEFAHYAIALRGGLPGATPSPRPRPRPADRAGASSAVTLPPDADATRTLTDFSMPPTEPLIGETTGLPAPRPATPPVGRHPQEKPASPSSVTPALVIAFVVGVALVVAALSWWFA